MLCSAVILLASFQADAQNEAPKETRNAALRYWIAFADMQDPPTDETTRQLLEKTVSGDVPWDEAKLGGIVQQNVTAILEMRRATKLPECDWGLEYSLGPRASVAFMMKLACWARGDSQAALKSWMTGVKFSQDLASGGTLVFVLVARAALLSDLKAIKISAEQGTLNSAARREALLALNSLPATGFNWSSSWQLETHVIGVGWDSILKSPDPREMYKAITGDELPASSHLPSPADFALFRKFMNEVAAALRLPPEEALQKLSSLKEQEKTLNPMLQNSIPSFERVNSNRAEVQAVREAALRALSAAPQK